MSGAKSKLWLTGVIAIAVAVASFYHYWQDGRIEETVSAPAGQEQRVPEIVVYVSGAVNHPGVIKVPADTRVLTVINHAGGLLPAADAAKVNMAQTVQDGMQINVPEKISSPGGQAELSKTDTRTGKININTADARALDKLPGVGPAIAEKIIRYREANGSFAAPEDLKKVPGIGDSKFDKMKEQIGI